MVRGRRWAAVVTAAAVTATVLASARPASAASRIQITSVDSGGLFGHMGLDNLGDNSGNYVSWTNWTSSGAVDGGGPAAGGIPSAHIEMYPDSTTGGAFQDNYDAWTQTVGGAHMWLRPVPASVNLGTVPLPRVGDGRGAFRMTGTIASSGAVPDNRFLVEWYQWNNWQQTSTGYDVGAFGLSRNRGTNWTAGVLWAGTYVLVVKDSATGIQVSGLQSFASGQAVVLDTDAYCFGMAQCQYDAGSPPASAGGGFHTMSPTRVLDSRNGTGIVGPLRPGDGRNADPNPDKRYATLVNHELKVTGLKGIPESGVSAVLLNVTVTEPSTIGWLGVYPRLDRTDLFDDQSWFRRTAATSNLNFNGGETLPNLVLARVGAGGYVRLELSQGAAQAVADVVGWFDSSGSTGNGDGFVGVVPNRLLDTRNGTGGIGGRFQANETRSLRVVGAFDVPTSASAVVLNVTEVDAGGDGFITVWPSGEARPEASSLNQGPGRTRPNLVVSKVGADGKVSIYFSGSPADLVIDVVGYYTRGGGATFAMAPVRIMDSRSGIGTERRAFGIQETRQLQVAGQNGIPAGAKAVIMNVTGTESAFGTHLTVWPSGVALPTASNVNVDAGATAPNLVMVKLGPDGKVSIYAHTGAQIIADAFGYVV